MIIKGCVALHAIITEDAIQVAQGTTLNTLHMEIQGNSCHLVPDHILIRLGAMDLFVTLPSENSEAGLKLFHSGRTIVAFITLDQLKKFYKPIADHSRISLEVDAFDLEFSSGQQTETFSVQGERIWLKGTMAESPMLIQQRSGDVQILMGVDLSHCVHYLGTDPQIQSHLAPYKVGRPLLVTHLASHENTRKMKVLMSQGRSVELSLSAQEMIAGDLIKVQTKHLVLTLKAGDSAELIF
jgi:hypothetical protein